jgi:hypothetical protein
MSSADRSHRILREIEQLEPVSRAREARLAESLAQRSFSVRPADYAHIVANVGADGKPLQDDLVERH